MSHEEEATKRPNRPWAGFWIAALAAVYAVGALLAGEPYWAAVLGVVALAWAALGWYLWRA